MKHKNLFQRLFSLNSYVLIFLTLLCLMAFTACDFNSNVKDDKETKIYTVTFDSTGGGIVQSQTVPHGETATDPGKPNPNKPDHNFLNWVDAEDNL